MGDNMFVIETTGPHDLEDLKEMVNALKDKGHVIKYASLTESLTRYYNPYEEKDDEGKEE